MSYDIHLEIDTGGPQPAMVCDVGNYTSNVSPMWHMALWDTAPEGEYGLQRLDGLRAGDVIQALESGCIEMRTNRKYYEAMNPENGWGAYDGALRYLEGILLACKMHPKATVRVSF